MSLFTHLLTICQFLEALMSLPIRYPPIPSYFQLSIIFLTLQILQHPPRWCDLFWPSHKPSCNHHRLYPIPHRTISPVPHQRPPIWPMDHIVTFSFLSLFSFTWRIPSRPDWSQVITPHDRDLTICFATHKSCACFAYHLYLRLLYLLQKTSFPQNSDLSSCHLIVSLCTFTLSCTPDTLHLIAPYRTSISHHFALLDTTSGDHFTAPKLHPSEPHRTYT